MFSAFSIILSLSALYSYVNHKMLKLLQTIGPLVKKLMLNQAEDRSEAPAN